MWSLHCRVFWILIHIRLTWIEEILCKFYKEDKGQIPLRYWYPILCTPKPRNTFWSQRPPTTLQILWGKMTLNVIDRVATVESNFHNNTANLQHSRSLLFQRVLMCVACLITSITWCGRQGWKKHASMGRGRAEMKQLFEPCCSYTQLMNLALKLCYSCTEHWLYYMWSALAVLIIFSWKLWGFREGTEKFTGATRAEQFYLLRKDWIKWAFLNKVIQFDISLCKWYIVW